MKMHPMYCARLNAKRVRAMLIPALMPATRKLVMSLMMLLSWALPQGAQAQWARGSGGDTSYVTNDVDGVKWQVHVFTTVGETNFTVTSAGEVEVLVVAGGGGGGKSGGGSSGAAGGGGAGGLLHTNLTVSAGEHEVVVGGGGAGGTVDTDSGRDGGNSSVFNLIAKGGGGGGGSNRVGRDGGSGGGGGATTSSFAGGAGETCTWYSVPFPPRY